MAHTSPVIRNNYMEGPGSATIKSESESLNLPDTPYTSGRVLHGVLVEMAKRKMKKRKKKSSRGDAIVTFLI